MHQENVSEIKAVDLQLADRVWPFAQANTDRIEAHWDAVVARAPASFNGPVLMTRNPAVRDGILQGDAIVTDYASFIAWSDWGWPDRTMFNLFGTAIVRAGDGALIFGVMGAHTLNPGQCYPPGGSLDPGDVAGGGKIDIMGSIARELAEETGLDAADATPAGLYAVFDGQRVSIAQVLQFAQPARTLAERARRHIAADAKAELDAVAVLHSSGDLPDPAPGYARMLARHLLG